MCSACAAPRPWTKGEKAVLIWSTLATAADAYTTTQALNNPNNCEMNPILGKYPSDGKVIAVAGNMLPIPFILINATSWNWVLFANVLLGINE